jgi:hypothetical protein
MLAVYLCDRVVQTDQVEVINNYQASLLIKFIWQIY